MRMFMQQNRIAAGIVRNLVPLLALAAFISAIYTYVTITGQNEPLGIKPKKINFLVTLNLALLVLLIGIVSTRVVKLWHAVRSGLAGSQLQKRIVILFSLVAILPTIAVSVFSALFFNLGIQTWFDERVQTAVNESLVVAEAYLKEHQENIRGDVVAMATDLNQSAHLAFVNPAEFNRIVATQSTLRELAEAIVFQRDKILAQGRFSFALAFETVPQNIIERAEKGDVVIIAEKDSDKVRALVRLEALPDAYLMVGRLIDAKVLTHMQNAQGAVNAYGKLKTQLDQLQIIFSVVFVTLALLLLLSSIGYGMVFAANLTKPISGLVGAAERVRGGDYSARVQASETKDEVGMLGRAFNRMTEQLQSQRTELIEANRRLDERRRFTEAVLFGVSAGVIALDKHKRINLFNRSSSTILSTVEQAISPDMAIEDVLPGIGSMLLQAEHLPGEVADSTLTLEKNNKIITLHVRVTVEKLGEEIEGFIVTFDDITMLVSAQRTAAWADVARRVAHEIKNPLTPIQLATERLKKKYLKFITEDEENYVKYIDTIAKHAGDIGKMVEEFVSFARMPTPVFTDEDIVSILKKAIFSAQVANSAIDFKQQMPESPVILHVDERQMSQVFTNLLKNAAESVEAKTSLAQNSTIQGKISISVHQENGTTYVVFEDNGTGFPGGDAQTMFEPYVTTRSKGTGLGLAIVKKIVEDHKGKILLDNISSGGARVTLSFLQHCDINPTS
jgi:two-component system nitrogen regulation sensor histidine kinase NtrY